MFAEPYSPMSSRFSIVSVKPTRNDFINRNVLLRIKKKQEQESNCVLDIDEIGRMGGNNDSFFDFQQSRKAEYLSRIENLKNDCDIFSVSPIKFQLVQDDKSFEQNSYHYKFINSDNQILREILHSSNFEQTDSNNWNFCWFSGKPKVSYYEKLKSWQKINHFYTTTEITRKDRLAYNLQAMESNHTGNFQFMPETYVLPQQFKEFYQSYLQKQGQWISKPAQQSQGRGIKIFSTLNELNDESCIVQRYIQNPLLINNLKFDLRVYVLITSFEPLRIYIYQEGITRFASQKFELQSRNKFQHLTNYSINKKSQTFQQNQNAEQDDHGHKWSITALLRHLRVQGIKTDLILSQIYDLVIKTIISCENTAVKFIKQNSINKHCFDLLGFDILLDSDLKAWLLEVNLNPSFTADSPLDRQIKSTLLLDTLNLVQINPNPQHITDKSKRLLYFQRSISPQKPSLNQIFSQDLDITLKEWINKGKFLRIYPSKNSARYLKFFQQKRPRNSQLFQQLYCDQDVLESPHRPITATSFRKRNRRIFNTLEMPLNSVRVRSEVSQQTNVIDGLNRKCINCKTLIQKNRIFCDLCNAKNLPQKLQLDDLVIEYLTRVLKVLRENPLIQICKATMHQLDSFLGNKSWKHPDQLEFDLWRRIQARIVEIREKNRIYQLTQADRRNNPLPSVNKQLQGVNSNVLEHMIELQSKQQGLDFVFNLVKSKGVLTQLQQQSLSKNKRSLGQTIMRTTKLYYPSKK